ncbi:hypothetical protein PR202_ga07808 [Eleusine coracana subsp. coracana]|uniref:Uncharacterized protein n=1 Tax=Eleusine coracana subsp. coracana TaxID=191504 RepID=A0AAV5BZP7_ELECO|nr:hypothetical protein PR202_ga07808 [Eleusine coracana subsp. coracana]
MLDPAIAASLTPRNGVASASSASYVAAAVCLVSLIAIQPFFGGEARTSAELQLVSAPIISLARRPPRLSDLPAPPPLPHVAAFPPLPRVASRSGAGLQGDELRAADPRGGSADPASLNIREVAVWIRPPLTSGKRWRWLHHQQAA